MPFRPDPDKIVHALRADTGFAQDQTDATFALFEQLARELPDVLAAHHDTPVTFSSLAAAKIAVIEHFMTAGYVESFVRAMPDNAFFSSTREKLAERLREMLPEVIEQFREILADAPSFLASQGVTEEQLLAHPRGGRFGEAAMQAYRAGTLTIGALLELQPAVIIKNTN